MGNVLNIKIMTLKKKKEKKKNKGPENRLL